MLIGIKNSRIWFLCALCFLTKEPLAAAGGFGSFDLAAAGIRQSCLPGQPARFGEQFRNHSQRKRPPKPTPKTQTPPANDLTKLRDDYINATKEYKASSQKLLVLYQGSQRKAEQRLEQMKELLKAGLVSRTQVEESEHAVAVEKEKVRVVEQQIATADTQIAQTLVEIEGDKQMAKIGPMRKGSTVRTASFIRFNGGSGFLLSNAGRIQNFFQQKFNRPLPIAVFGQGAIHDRWRLDHRNAMDISLNPDGQEGQALMDFLRANGIPFSAFRGAIPGVATGPHIHIGLPSHRY